MNAQAWARTLGAALLASVLTMPELGMASAADLPAQEGAASAMESSAIENSATEGLDGDKAASQRFTFALYNMPLIDALDMLAARSGREIGLSGPAQNAPIDARFVAASFEKALSEILRSRQHVILGFEDGAIEIELLDAPVSANPAAFSGQGLRAKELGLFPISDEVMIPEKPQPIGLRPGGISLDLASEDPALGPGPAAKAPPVNVPVANASPAKAAPEGTASTD